MENKKRELRKFGFTLAVVFTVWGTLCILRKNSYSIYFFIFSGIFLIMGLISPYALRLIQKIWTGIFTILNLVIKIFILNMLFFLVLTPCGILARLFGNKYLDLEFGDGRESYWRKRPQVEIDKARYEEQF
ncbi:MAG: hypothetical protein A2Z72_01155 [Omnitrophica bacterium RBG_13_46_9]|nr:MAG: hypothetical protein A2Z72_01155 [Omnitrophica bacterium RBG_13_46_9]